MIELTKVLSSNDVGSTGGHQSGVVIPIKIAEGGFFPPLDPEIVNPRVQLDAVVEGTGKSLKLNFIFYNGKRHKTSTRNEYRLTGVATFLRESSAQEGDRLVITKAGEHRFLLRLVPVNLHNEEGDIVVSLSKDWFYRRSA
jgi:hypothetical protein